MAFDGLELLLIVALNGLVDSLLVAWVAGIQAQRHTERWFLSERAKPVMQKIASAVRDDVMADVPSRLDLVALKADIVSETKQLLPPVPDLVPLEESVAQIRDFVEGLDARTAQAFQSVKKEVPERVAEYLGTMKAHEVKALYKEMGATEEEMQTLAENSTAVGLADPESMLLRKLMGIKPSPEYASAHPIAAALLDVGKAVFIENLQTGGMNIPGMGRLRGRVPRPALPGPTQATNPFLKELGLP